MKASDHACTRCGRRAAHSHHRLPRSRGGLNDTINLVYLCNLCHMHVHRNPVESERDGWTVSGYMLRGRYVGGHPEYRRFYNEAA